MTSVGSTILFFPCTILRARNDTRTDMLLPLCALTTACLLFVLAPLPTSYMVWRHGGRGWCTTPGCSTAAQGSAGKCHRHNKCSITNCTVLCLDQACRMLTDCLACRLPVSFTLRSTFPFSSHKALSVQSGVVSAKPTLP
jgi:hypothetical protein